MEKVLQFSEIRLFADDALIFVTGSSGDECIDQLNTDLENVANYLKMNKLKLNTSKTKAMIINAESNKNIIIDNVIIEQVNEIKYLGVIIDKQLKFDKHLNEICKKNCSENCFFQTN